MLWGVNAFAFVVVVRLELEGIVRFGGAVVNEGVEGVEGAGESVWAVDEARRTRVEVEVRLDPVRGLFSILGLALNFGRRGDEELSPGFRLLILLEVFRVGTGSRSMISWKRLSSSSMSCQFHAGIRTPCGAASRSRTFLGFVVMELRPIGKLSAFPGNCVLNLGSDYSAT
jgi:hypothetical protein